MQRLFICLMLFGLAACSGLPYDARPPKVSVAEVDIKSLGIFEQRFDVALRVGNPNDFDLRIEALEFDLEVNGHAFATGLARTSALIPAISNTVIRVDAVTQSSNLIKQIKTLPAGALRAGVPYRISGRVKTDHSARWIRFDHKGLYGRDEKPRRDEDRPTESGADTPI
ncbi:MAG: LEA type 2 family protein [Thiobacillus sp.]|nr:LEA type 2 family protein [Thiobacillus sp.]